jgi:hypothetical protein
MLKLAFYRASNDKWKSRLIDLVTGRHGYSHVELVFGDGFSFSSSDRDGGVRFKKITFKAERWVIIDYPVDAWLARVIRLRAEKLVGAKYDWLGIFLHGLLPLGIHSKSKWWCDEVINHVLNRKPEKTSPNEMARRMGVPRAG